MKARGKKQEGIVTIFICIETQIKTPMNLALKQTRPMKTKQYAHSGKTKKTQRNAKGTTQDNKKCRIGGGNDLKYENADKMKISTSEIINCTVVIRLHS